MSKTDSLGTRTGEIEIACQYNTRLARDLYSIGLQQATTYPQGQKGALDIATTELCYIPKSEQNSNRSLLGNRNSLPVLSSFNGQGAIAAQLFPNDEVMQVEAILNSIRVIGTAFDSIPFDTETARPHDLSVQVKGVHWRQAKCHMFPGTLVESYLPTPKELMSADRVPEGNITPTKVTLELRPFDPRLAGERVMGHIRRILYDESAYRQSMDVHYRSTNAYVNFADTFFAFSQLAGVLFAHSFGPHIARTFFTRGAEYGAVGGAAAIDLYYNSVLGGLMAAIQNAFNKADTNLTVGGVSPVLPAFWGEFEKELKVEIQGTGLQLGSNVVLSDIDIATIRNNALAHTKDPTEVNYQEALNNGLLLLSWRLGLLDSTTDMQSTVKGVPGSPEFSASQFHIDDDIVLADIKRRFLASVFWDGRISELAFGYGSRGTSPAGLPPGVDIQSGRIAKNTPFGNFLDRQLNLPNMLMSGIFDVVRRHLERIEGKVTRGAPPGQAFAWVN